ncbi:hypothetical protein KC887_01275 [Candidatus Kaiserbacteria bacterium]|nr:hypothetical protein [Candidatus Kaiserbacteria bacterium]
MKKNLHPGKVNGLHVSNMQLSQRENYTEVMTYGFPEPYMLRETPDRLLSISLYAADSSNFDFSNFPLGEPLLGLGEGFICEHCHTYTPRGKYLCQNCTAPLVKKELIRPFRFPFVITDISVSIPFGDYAAVDLSLTGVGETDNEFIYALTSGSFHMYRTQEYINVLSGLYLCHYCGTATKGDRCEACDGGRLPFHELVDMQHECLYCGSKTVNGIVCDSCGARMAGTPIYEKMNIDYLSPYYAQQYRSNQ